MNVEEVPIETVKPYWRNPRNNDKTVSELKRSIQKFGFQVPLVVDEEGTIITGHARYKALVQLGWKTVPVVVADLPAEKAKEFRIADNKLSELATWDEDQLRAELRELEKVVGWEEEELERFLDDKKNIKYDSYTDEDIKKTEESLNEKFEREERLTTITCPHCTEDFQVNVDDLERSVKWE